MIEQEHEDYELFCQAILHQNGEAWADIHRRYRLLLIAWVCRSGARISEDHADIADQALARAWAALTPERFADFPTLARLLSYLHTCVTTTIIDCIRAQATNERVLLEQDTNPSNTPEQIVIADLDRHAVWRIALGVAATPAERVALVESFAYCLPPRAIHVRHPQLFPDVTAVYSTKRNLFERLQRNSDLRRLCQEIVSS